MSRRNPRSEVLIASKHRSGSLHEMEGVTSPTEPLSPNSTDENTYPDFPTVYNADSLTKSHQGSKVSRIKEMFQPHNGTDENKFQPIKVHTSYHHYAPPIISPPPMSKRKLPQEPISSPPPTVPRDTEPTSPPAVNPKGLNEPTSHVQRFNYTRALFARLEEETKMQQERERLRRPSPVSGATSPVLSPDRLTARSPEGIKRTPSEDARHPEAQKRYKSGSDLNVSSKPPAATSRRSRADQRPPVPSRKPDLRPAYSEPSIPKSVISSISSTPGGLLWKRRQNEDVLSEISNLDKYGASKNRTNLSQSSSQLEESVDIENNNQMLENSVFSQPDLSMTNGSVTEDLSVTSAYQPRKSYHSPGRSGFDRNLSSSAEVLSSRSRSLSNEYAKPTSERSRPNGHEEGQKPVVTYRQKAPSKIITSAPGKRISKEEIQAALDRADTYLQRVSGSSDETDSKPKPLSPEFEMTTSDITSHSTEQKEPVSEQIMSKSDSKVQSAEPQSQLRSWARYRNQRYSRTSDYLEDKVGDVSKLGSISDTSVSSFRKDSFENLSKSPERSKSPETNQLQDTSERLQVGDSTVRTSENETSFSNRARRPDILESSTSVKDGTIKSETNIDLKTEKLDSIETVPNEHEPSITDSFSRISHSTVQGPPLPQRPIPVTVPRHKAPSPNVDATPPAPRKTPGPPMPQTPIPVPTPRRTAPSPPMDTPPPPPPKTRGSPPKYRPPMPSEPPPPAPSPGATETTVTHLIKPVLQTNVSVASVLPSDVNIPPVPMRHHNEQVVQLFHDDAMGETSDSEDLEPLQRVG